MTKIDLKCAGANLSARVDGEITAGMRGIGVEISFDEAWQGLTPVLVVSCGETVRRMAVDASGHSSVPWECCISGEKLNVGLCGLNEDGTVKLPTVWASCGRVHPSPEDVQAEQGSAPPTPDLVEQITALAFNAQAAANAVTEAAQRGEFNGQPGVTPELSVGTVTTLPAGSAATASITGTARKPILNLGIPAGEAGAKGEEVLPQGGAAVVFGDSLFENPGVYSFADFLRGKGIYREVVNYAVGGCCFYSTDQRLSLTDILLEEAVQADVARADEIWLHLGGNDITKRVFEGGSYDVLFNVICYCINIIKNLNPDVLIRYVAPTPKPPELINTHAIKKVTYGDYTFTDADIANICESVFAIDLAFAYSEMPIVQCRKYCPDIVSETPDGIHPTTTSAQAFFESILSADFNGTQTIDYFTATENDIGLSDSFIADGKIAKNAVLCFFGSANSLSVIQMNTLFGKMTGSVILPDTGIVLKAEIENGHLLISNVPLNPAEKEWQLKGTITNPTERITVDMSGCTELFVTGIVNATGSSFLSINNGGNLVPNFASNGTREWFSHWKDIVNGMECISSRSNTSGIGVFSAESGGYSILSRKISSIETIFIKTPEVVTSCDVKIYAR